MKTFSPKNKIHGFAKVLMVTITIVSTIGYSPFNAIFLTSSSSVSVVPVAQACTTYCGDGIKNGTEQCDGTSGVGLHQSCSKDCKLINLPWCGDGIKNDSEQCDGIDGVSVHQTCSAQCTLINLNYCGDNIKNQETEQCDGTDGVGLNQSCSSDCKLVNLPYCGDGVKNGTEECDATDGVGIHQSCGQDCKLINLPWCGDGIKNGTEACDGTDGVLAHYTCTENCELQLLPFCGDGVLQPDEQCDDGNIIDGDGCSAQCKTETLCQTGETQTNFDYNSKPQTTYIDNSTTNVAYKLCSDTCGNDLSVDTSDGQPHYIYLTWDNLNPSDYNGFLNFNLKLNHMENQSNIKVELKNQLGTWIEVCDPTERTGYTLDSCNLAPYSLILKGVSEVELRIVATKAGACHEYLKCAKLEAQLYTCEGPQPYCGDGIKNDSEECDGTDGVGAHQSCGQDCKLINLPYCGDGVKNDSEQCDGTDGVGEHQACTDECTLVNLTYCGDNIKNGDEQCDGTDGVTEHHICTAQCTLEYVPYCGDGIINQDSEQCDDGNVVDGDGCSAECKTELPICDKDKELVINGSFESPLIADSQSWNIFTTSQLNSWNVEWVSLTPSTFNNYTRPTDAYLELQNSLTGFDPQNGNQYAELDSDWDGPTGTLNGEPASVKIHQDIPTIAGATYHISFWFSPRPNTNLEENRLELQWNGDVKATLEAAGENNTTWVKHDYTFTATGTTTRLQFADMGYADSEGTFLDNVSVKCVPPQEPICGDGIKNQTSEECDGTDGVGAHQSCSQDCQLINLPWCGDGVKNDAEQCDGTDGVSAHYTCTAQCTLQYIPYCGDNLINQLTEQCDGTAGVGQNQACTSECTLINIPTCGNGIKEGQEECDGTDGVIEHHACTSQCTLEYIPYCGDNIVNQTSEQCDGTAGVGENQTCTAECILQNIPPGPICGDGIVNQTSEQCDGTAGVGAHQSCSSECTLVNLPYCGDSIKNGAEQCDGTDGVGANQVCSSTCTLTNIPFCGDATCNNEETCGSCSSDCGSCGGGGGGGGGSPYPALAITKSVAESTITPGGTLNYTITLKNNGFATAINVNLKDTLPAGFTFKDNGLNEKEWNLGDIAYGVTKVTTFQALVGNNVTMGDYENTAVAKATNQGAIYGLATTTVVTGQVLGARTELPNTGQSPIWFVVIGLSLAFGSLLTLVVLRRTIILPINN